MNQMMKQTLEMMRSMLGENENDNIIVRRSCQQREKPEESVCNLSFSTWVFIYFGEIFTLGPAQNENNKIIFKHILVNL